MFACYVIAIWDKMLFELISASIWVYSLFFMIWLFQMTSIHLALILYREHKHEFHKHIRSMVTMQIATIVTLGFLIFIEFLFIYIGMCTKANEQGVMFT